MSAYSDWKCGAIDEQERDYFMELEDRADRERMEREERNMAMREQEDRERKENGVYCRNCTSYLYNGDKDFFMCTNVDSDLCGDEVDEKDWCGEFDRR